MKSNEAKEYRSKRREYENSREYKDYRNERQLLKKLLLKLSKHEIDQFGLMELEGLLELTKRQAQKLLLIKKELGVR